MRKFLVKNIKLIALILLFSIVHSLCIVFLAVYLGRAVDVAASRDNSSFIQLAMLGAVFCVLFLVVRYAYGIVERKFAYKISKLLREEAFDAIYHQSLSDYNKRNTADYTSMLTNDINIILENYVEPFLLIIRSIFIFVGSLIYMIYLSIPMTIILVLCLTLTIIVPKIMTKIIQNKQEKYSKDMEKFTGDLKDYFSGFETVYCLNSRVSMIKEFKKTNDNVNESKYRVDSFLVINEAISATMGTSVQFLILNFSIFFIFQEKITLGTMLAIVQIADTLIYPFITILQNFPKMKSIQPVLIKLFSFKKENEQGVEKCSFNENITIKNLSFSYEPNNLVLKDLNLTLKKNKKYVILGKSGCGKSTLLKILTSQLRKFEGDIEIDQEKVSNLSNESLFNLISIVHQNVFMFNATIEENIKMLKDYHDKDLQYAVKLSGLLDYLTNKGKSLKTEIDEGGKTLSGGEKQRIALARALIRRSPIIILDEGMSALDQKTVAMIEERLLTLENITLITVTHNLNKEILQKYDNIIYLESGIAKCIGNYNEIIKNKSFNEFISLQNFEEDINSYE